MSAAAKTNPIKQLSVGRNGELRPVMYTNSGQGLSDVRTVSGEFLLDLQRYWREYGWDCLVRTGEKFPELIVASQVKLAKVMRVEVGGPGEFAAVASKAEILEKLEERAGPEARKLFEKFTRDLAKLQEKQKNEAGAKWTS
jgi:hypothetical protein